ncbi:condensation domain-containing protein [Actinokineospora sp. 24-640]
MTDTQLSDLTPEQRRLLELRLRERAADQPLSFTQEQLWFLDRLDPGNPAYAIAFGLRLTGALDRSALARALAETVRRHPALRTSFTERGGELRQRVHDTAPLPLPVTDLTGLPAGEREAAAERVAAEHARHGFDLSTAPLVAVRLVVLAEREHLLLVAAHHIVFDAASSEVFGRDLAALYGGQDLPAPTTSFGAHAAAERRRLTAATLGAHLDYWRAKLADCPTSSTLPTDRPRPAVRTHRGGKRRITVGAELTAALAERARRTGVTLNALVLTAFAAMVRQASGQESVLLGMPVAGRPRTELEPVVGSFANMLVLRVDVPGEATVTDVLRGTHRAISEAHAHQDAPYARVVEAVDPPRDPSRNPLFQVMVSITDAPSGPRAAGGVEFRPVEVDSGLTDFDLFVVLSRVDGELRGEIGYNADLYFDSTVDRIAERLPEVLAAIADGQDRALDEAPALRRHTVSVASTFTADPLRDPMDTLTGVLGVPLGLELAPYQQLVQHLIGGPSGSLADVALVRWEDWLRHAEATPAALDAAWADFAAAIRAHRARAAVPLLVVVCPASPAFAGWAPVLGGLDDRLAELADTLDGVHPVWFADWAREYPVGTPHDAQADKLAHVPYTAEMFAALATLVTARLHDLGAVAAHPGARPDLAPPVALAERAAPARTATAALDSPPVAPRNPTEERLAALWRQVLGLDEVGVTHDFFALGGHSLLATQLLSRVHAEFGADVSLHALFAAPTIAAIAELVAESAEQSAHELVPVPRDGGLGLSAIQQRLWAVGQLDGDPTRHNTTVAVLLRGDLDVEALRAALAAVVARHEILRTGFTEVDGVPVMTVREHADCWLPPLDLRGQSDVDEHIQAHTAHHYDLARGPLLRVRLLRTAEDEHHLLLGMHHIICDNSSWGVLLAELSAGYAGRGADLPPLPVQFADYAAWQRELLTESAMAPHVAYWRERLSDAPALFTTRRGPNRTERVTAHVPDTVATAVRGLAMAEGVTPFTALLAAYALLLTRQSGQSDVTLSVPQAGRPRPELEHLIGCFTDLLPVRVDLAGRPTFRQAVQRVHRAVVAGYQHLDLPFSSLVDAMRLPRGNGRHPVFQCAFNVADLPEDALSWPGLDLVPVDTPVTALDFDLFLTLTAEDGGLAAVMEHTAGLFDDARAVLAEFTGLLADLSARPDEPVAAETTTESTTESTTGTTAGATAETSAGTAALAVASSFAVDSALPVLAWWGDKLGLPAAAGTAPAGQILRPLLAPFGGREIDALVLRWADLLPADPNPGAVGEFERGLTRLCRALRRRRERTDAPLTVLVAPSPGLDRTPWPGVFGHAADRLARLATVVDLGDGDPGVLVGTALARLLHRHAAVPVRTVLVDPDRFPTPGHLAAFTHAQARLGRRVTTSPSAGTGSADGVLAIGVDGHRRADLPAEPAALAHLWPLDPPGAGGDYAMPAELAAEIAGLRTPEDIAAAIAGVGTGAARQAPRTEREKALAAIWQDVLRVPEVGVHDDFYALGGDSMTAIQVVWLATQAGIKLVPSQLAARPTIAQLCAEDTAEQAATAEQGRVDGTFPATGAQLWFFEALAPSMADPAHFNHPYYLRLRRPVPVAHLAKAVGVLAEHHDGLRLRFRRDCAGWQAEHTAPETAVPFHSHDLSHVPAAERERAVLAVLNERHPQLSLDGPLAQVLHFGLGDEPDRLMVVCHHLVTDGVSRTLILEDLQTLLLKLEAGEEPELPAKTTAYRDWARLLADHTRGEELLAELPFWEAQRPGAEDFPVDLPGDNRFGVMDSLSRTLDADLTRRLRVAAKTARVGIHDLLVWATVALAADRTGSPEWTIATTGHGREALFDGVDLTRTMGWFQVLYPIRVALPPRTDDITAVKAVARTLKTVPANGIGYSLLRHAHPDPAVRARLDAPNVQLTVNFVGTFGFDDISAADELFDLCAEDLGVLQDPATLWPGRLDLVGAEVGDELRLEMNFGTEVHRRETVEALLADIEGLLRRLVTAANS